MSAGRQRAAAVLAALIVAALFLLVERWSQPGSGSRLVHAQVGQNPDEVGTRPVVLPHRWAEDPEHCAGCRSAWYRFDIQREPPPAEAQALWLPAVGRNAAVYLNGQLVAQGGRFSAPAARLGARSLWAVTPAAMWNPGANRLYVLVQADPPRWGAMPAPALGSAAELRGAHRWRELMTETLPQVSGVAAVMLAMTMALIWFYRRRQRDHLAAAVAALAYAAFAFTTTTVEPPWNNRAWDLALALAALVLAAAMGLLGARLLPASTSPRRLKAAALVWGAVAVGGLTAIAIDDSGGAFAATLALALALLAAVGSWLAMMGWRRQHGALLAAGALLATAAIADLARGSAPSDALPALPLGVSIALGVAAWQLLLGFVQTLNAVELLKIDLEAIVAERTQALQQQFTRVRELERQQIVAGERERLMRDMHDGVGGHLVSMLAMIEADRRRPAELATVVRDALTDMRLMIDSLEPVDDDLNAVLAMLHDRLAPRLKASGVALHWDVDVLPPVPGLTPSRVLHVLRVLQEAVSNALRHGRARTLWLSARPQPTQVDITLRDDGVGFDPALASPGRGLKNMRRRATDASVEVTVRSAPGQGTTVALTIAR